MRKYVTLQLTLLLLTCLTHTVDHVTLHCENYHLTGYKSFKYYNTKCLCMCVMYLSKVTSE